MSCGWKKITKNALFVHERRGCSWCRSSLLFSLLRRHRRISRRDKGWDLPSGPSMGKSLKVLMVSPFTNSLSSAVMPYSSSSSLEEGDGAPGPLGTAMLGVRSPAYAFSWSAFLVTSTASSLDLFAVSVASSLDLFAVSVASSCDSLAACVAISCDFLAVSNAKSLAFCT